MSNQKLCRAAALTVLCTATVMAMPPVHAAGQESMVVVRDAQTGELRAPTAAEAAALRSKSALQRQALPKPPLSVGPGGGSKVQLGKSALVYNVVTRDANGKLTEQCVNSAQAADEALAHPASSKEPRHEAE